MVQYTNVIIASAVVAALPAIAAPIRDVEIEARSGVAKAAIDLALHGPARSTITKPLKKTVSDHVHGSHHVAHGPGPAHQHSSSSSSSTSHHHSGPNVPHLSTHKKESPIAAAGAAGFKHAKDHPVQHALNNGRREFDDEDFEAREFDDEELEARSGVAKAAIDLALHGPARSTITKPLKKTVSDHVHGSHHVAHGPGPAHHQHSSSSSSSSHHSAPHVPHLSTHKKESPIAAAGAAAFKHAKEHPVQHALNNGRREFDAEEFEARDFEDEDYLFARSGVAKAVIDHALHGPARSTLTKPLKKTVSDHLHGSHHVAHGPSLAHQHHSSGSAASHHSIPHIPHLSTPKKESPIAAAGAAAFKHAKEHPVQHALANGRREYDDEDYFFARSGLGRTAIDLALHGPARSTITKPLKKTVSDHLHASHGSHGPGLAHQHQQHASGSTTHHSTPKIPHLSTPKKESHIAAAGAAGFKHAKEHPVQHALANGRRELEERDFNALMEILTREYFGDEIDLD